MDLGLLDDVRDATGNHVEIRPILNDPEKVVVLLFSARWCPMARAAIPAIRRWHLDNQDNVTIIVVSSDTTKEELHQQLVSLGNAAYWISFDSDAADRLKLFHLCWARKEGTRIADKFGMERKRMYGLPTIIGINSEGQAIGVITEDSFPSAEEYEKLFGEKLKEGYKLMQKSLKK